MKILFCSVPFRPRIGGIETVSEILAARFNNAGHEVLLVTQTPGTILDNGAFQIIRRPSSRALWNAVRWADIVFHNNISLRFAWPLLILRRPWVVAHHTWTPRTGAGRLKHLATRFAVNIAVSEAIAESLSVAATIVPNPYADDLFVCRPDVTKSRDLVFLGRLEPGKGVSVIFDALAALRERGEERTLTVIGGGPEERALREQARTLHLERNVCFTGFRQGTSLVDLLHQHRIMIVPSVWEEPFGIVALEAIACGLVPIVTHSGGLPNAVGRCGLVVPKLDSMALASAIQQLNDDELVARLRAEAPQHLARHTRDNISEAYLRIMALAVKGM